MWWLIVSLTAAPAYLLPGPFAVARALWSARAFLFAACLTTGGEILAGLALGIVLGGACGLAVTLPPVRRWLQPMLLISQAVPVFALAPVLVLWFGFGMMSKIVMAVLVIFFPVASALADGVRRTDQGLLDLARTMGAGRWSLLWHVRVPAALPAFGAGVRIAAAIAPIGAIIGEWVGSSAGLGYVMMNANARMQTDLMFAALCVLAVMTVAVWTSADMVLRRLLFWAPET